MFNVVVAHNVYHQCQCSLTTDKFEFGVVVVFVMSWSSGSIMIEASGFFFQSTTQFKCVLTIQEVSLTLAYCDIDSVTWSILFLERRPVCGAKNIHPTFVLLSSLFYVNDLIKTIVTTRLCNFEQGNQLIHLFDNSFNDT